MFSEAEGLINQISTFIQQFTKAVAGFPAAAFFVSGLIFSGGVEYTCFVV